MLTLIIRYIMFVAVFVHCLLSGHGHCCATTCPVDDAASVFSLYHCHSEQHGRENYGGISFCNDLEHDCGHEHDSCQFLQSVNRTGFRVVLDQNLFFLPIAFHSATSVIPTLGLNHQTPEMMGGSSVYSVRLHLLLGHFLI